MRVVSAAEIDRALTFPALVDALAEAFCGDIVAPVRHHHEIEREGAHGTLLLMPAWTGNASTDGFMGVKVVSVFPDNGAKSLPSVLGTYLLMDGAHRRTASGIRRHPTDRMAYRRRLGAGGARTSPASIPPAW